MTKIVHGPTPGPWDYVPSTEHHGPYVTSDFGNTLFDGYKMSYPGEASTANGGRSRPIHHMHEMADANMSIAAAAWEMLELLKEIVDTFAADGVQDAAIGQAKEIIAKAERYKEAK